MTLRNIFLFLLFIGISVAFIVSDEGKSTYLGYLIWNDGIRETVKIQPGSITDNEVKIKYLVAGKVISIKPENIKSYGYTKASKNTAAEIFHYDRLEMPYPAKPFGGNTAMVLREVSGPVKLYSYFVEVRTDRKNPVQHRPYLLDDKGRLIEVTEENFRQKTKRIFRSYTALQNRIGTKGFEMKNLRRMVRDYNYWMAKRHNVEIYKVSPENWDGGGR